jgi:hypothetical protein
VQQYSPNLATYIRDLSGRSNSFGIQIGWLSASSSSSQPGASWSLHFCTADGDGANVQLNADLTWSYVDSRDAWNNMYPRPDETFSGRIEGGVVGDIYMSHIDRAYNGPIHTSGSGGYAYVTAVYVNGVLVSVPIEFRPF